MINGTMNQHRDMGFEWLDADCAAAGGRIKGSFTESFIEAGIS